MKNSILKAKEFFYNREYQLARDIFYEENMLYEAGLCSLLLDDIEQAKKCWREDTQNQFASSWGLKVLDYINLKVNYFPSYLQVRAFYEVYINLLIENDMIEYAQNLLGVHMALMRCNPETYKFISRVLQANEYYDLSLEFAKKANETSYPDPEALYIAAQIYYQRGENSKAFDELKMLLDILPNYYPAIKLKEKMLKDS